MSSVNNQFKELINEAVDNCYHNNIEMKIILKDWLHGICEQLDEYEAKSKAFDAIMREWEDERMTKSHILETIQKYYDEYGSGEVSNLHLHVKTGGTYQVINESVINATNSANSYEMVLYKDTASGKLFVRSKEEFNDGRFIPIEGSNDL